MNIKTFLVILIINLILYFICSKNKFLIDKKDKQHKLFAEQLRVNYLLGGLFFMTYFSVYFFNIKNDYKILFPLFLILLLGICSDSKILENVKLRFILQIIIILFAIKISNIQIIDTRLLIFNELLKNNFISLIFTIFCLMIFVNGVNFIDGINTLAILYLTSIVVVILCLNYFYGIKLNYNFFLYFLYFLLITIILNYHGIIFLGDSGAYLLSLVIGANLIEIVNNNNIISPYFIILLVIYPCFEILFSIIRRAATYKKTYNADNFHIHQILYKFLKNKNLFNKLNLHLATSVSINLFLIIFFIIGLIFFNDTKILVTLILIKIFIYSFLYYHLKKINFLISLELSKEKK
jgi:UDP-N-acetylmuramyl pentapeptide phosphotransferase/UDP-N-acetylglucosamine-1-phosphate transferase